MHRTPVGNRNLSRASPVYRSSARVEEAQRYIYTVVLAARDRSAAESGGETERCGCCVFVSAGPRRCLALSPLQAAAAGPHQAQPVDAARRAHTAPQEVPTGNRAQPNAAHADGRNRSRCRYREQTIFILLKDVAFLSVSDVL